MVTVDMTEGNLNLNLYLTLLKPPQLFLGGGGQLAKFDESKLNQTCDETFTLQISVYMKETNLL
jgi:hypothetical protein